MPLRKAPGCAVGGDAEESRLPPEGLPVCRTCFLGVAGVAREQDQRVSADEGRERVVAVDEEGNLQLAGEVAPEEVTADGGAAQPGEHD